MPVTVANPLQYSVDNNSLANACSQYLEEQRAQSSAAIFLIDENRMVELNENYKHHQGATDVLSFPLHDPEQPTPAFIESPETQQDLGDIFICVPVVQKEYADPASFYDRLVFLAKHGLDHLLGRHHE